MLWLRRIAGTVVGIFTPGYSACYRCLMPWSVTEGHSTQYTRAKGCFPLCEHCWSRLTPPERLPYYARLWVEWGADASGEDWDAIEAAVLAGR